MTFPSDTAANDAIFAVCYGVWQAQSPGLVGYVPELRWPGRMENSKPPVEKIWARVSQQTVNQSKTALTNGDEPQRYTTNGLLFIQFFSPLADPTAFDKMKLLAEAVRDGYRSAQIDGAMFRNERIKEIPNDDKSYRRNMIVEYEYDALGG